MRLPDIYYTRQKVQGAPEEYGLPDPPTFSQGDSILFQQYLEYEGTPVSTKDWDIEVTVKSTAFTSSTTLFGGVEGASGGSVGFYKIHLPKEVTAALAPGTYFLDIRITQPIGSGTPKDQSITISKIPFLIILSVGSPNPQEAIPLIEGASPLPTAITGRSAYADESLTTASGEVVESSF